MKDHNNMNFWEHLETLRWHLLRSIVAVLVGAVVAFVAKDFIFDVLLLAPISPKFVTNEYLLWLAKYWDLPALAINQTPLSLQSIQLSGQLAVHLTVSLVAGFIIAFPYVFYQIWSFVAPALHSQEKKYTNWAIFMVSLLFFLGVLFGYYIITPLAVDFLGNYSVSAEVKNVINIRSYIGAVTSIVLSSGIVFELPIVIYFLVKVEIVNANFLRKYRRHALILIMIVSAILTPPDPFSLLLVSFPLYLLYELSIWIARWVEKSKKRCKK